jgi:class 3 adenylate cyclase/tetratricopeptide (TPR) repeat protein
MKCPRCQHENPSQAKFCLECGARLAHRCSQCGTELPAGAKFCLECGHAVGGPIAGQDRFRSPESYTPKHLAEKILTSKSAFEGERKQVTVLFADLKGSMELLADRDPEEARQILDPVLERMMEAVHRYEGTVNQVMGDGIMALFGAPIAHEAHAVRAGYAALKMQESIGAYAEELKSHYDVSTKIRIGLNSGEVVVRGIGSDLRMDYSAVGQTTHLAARMEQLATPGTILVTEAFARLTEGYLHFKPLGLVQIKGLTEAVDVLQLVDAEPTRGRFQAAARGLTRFVGREAELADLARAMERAREGHGQAVAIIGEPGVGKSRLFYEFVDSPWARDWLVLETGSVSFEKARAYQPLRELLKQYFEIEDRDDAAEIQDRVAARLTPLDQTVHSQSLIPPLLALLDSPVEDSAWQAFDPVNRRQAMLDGAKRLLLAQSRVQPLLLIFENLHWIDPETQAFLDSLIDSLPTARIMLFVNYRPEYRHGWGSKTFYTQLRLDPLPAENADELLDVLLGASAELPPLKRLLIQRTEGNPFFLEESVRTLVETKMLVGERGARRLGGALPSIRVPATVQSILAARIDRLSAEDKHLLQCAAVIGKDVSFSLLRAIMALPEGELGQSLSKLRAAEFLYETSLFPEIEYTFKHALTHEVAYGSLLQQRRRVLHASLVEAIEAMEAERLSRHLDRLAYHAFRGELWDKALRYARQAGARAMERSAYAEAVGWLEQGVAAVEHLPGRADVLGQAVDLRLDLRNALLPLGEHSRILDRLGEAARLATSLKDQRRLGWVSANMAREFALLGQPERAVAEAARALSLAVAHGDFGLQITATSVLGQAHYAEGAYARGADALRSNVAALEGSHRRERLGLAGLPSVTSRTFLVFCLAEVGEFDEAEHRGAEAVRLAEAVDHPYSLAHALFGVGHVCLRQGDVNRAIAVLERGLRLCDEKGIRFAITRTASSLGHAYAMSGRVSEGLSLLRRAVEEAEKMHAGYCHALWLTWLAEGHLVAGETREARQVADLALTSADSHFEQGHKAWALRLSAELLAQSAEGIEGAAVRFQHVLALASELGMRPLAAHCHLGLGKLYRRTGQREQALEHLTTATTMYREMDMRFWLEQAEAELKD